MSKDTLFEEATWAITNAAISPAGIEAGLVPWAPINELLVDYSQRFDARANAREAASSEANTKRLKAEARARRLQLRVQEMDRRPTVSFVSTIIAERDELARELEVAKRQYDSRVEESHRLDAEVERLEKKLALVRSDLAAMITIYEQEPQHVGKVIQAIRERPQQVRIAKARPAGPTDESIRRAQQAHAANMENRSISDYNFDQAILEAVQALAKRMDSTEGDAFNILKELKKMEGG
jgi:hypothetical protein